jgi:hypothetical protein
MNGPVDDWRGYLLGRLPDEAVARLECRLLADDMALAALREAETDLHDDHARELLSVADHQAFRIHRLRVSAAARSRQRFAQALKPVPEAARRSPRAVARPGNRRPSWTLLAAALIAGLLALTLSLNPQWLAPADATGRVAVTVRDAAPPTVLLLARSAADARQPVVALSLSPQARELRVQAGITHAEEARLYRLRVLAEGAADDAVPLFEARDLPLRTAGTWRHVEVPVPAAVLLGATRIVRVDSQPPAGPYADDWTVRAPVRTTPDLALPVP